VSDARPGGGVGRRADAGLAVRVDGCVIVALATLTWPVGDRHRGQALAREEFETDRDAFTFAPSTAGPMRYGTGFEEEDAFSQWAPSSVVKVPVGERWNARSAGRVAGTRHGGRFFTT